MNQCWSNSLTHICGTSRRWFVHLCDIVGNRGTQTGFYILWKYLYINCICIYIHRKEIKYVILKELQLMMKMMITTMMITMMMMMIMTTMMLLLLLLLLLLLMMMMMAVVVTTTPSTMTMIVTYFLWRTCFQGLYWPGTLWAWKKRRTVQAGAKMVARERRMWYRGKNCPEGQSIEMLLSILLLVGGYVLTWLAAVQLANQKSC